MINWDLLTFRNILVIALLALLAMKIFNHFSAIKE